jgi:hypothetical protein
VTDVPALLEIILRRLDGLALRVEELAVDVERQRPVLMTTMGEPNIIDLDDDADLAGAVSPPPIALRLVIDNEQPEGR